MSGIEKQVERCKRLMHGVKRSAFAHGQLVGPSGSDADRIAAFSKFQRVLRDLSGAIDELAAMAQRSEGAE